MSRSSLAPRPPKHLGFRATLGALLGIGATYALGCDGPTCAASGGLAAVSVRIALVDLKLRIIHDGDVLAMAVIGAAWILWAGIDPWLDFAIALLRGAAYAAAFQAIRLGYLRLRGRDGLGFGDVKLVAATGPWLTVDAFGVAVAGAAIAGILFAALRAHIKGRPSSPYTFVPFGFLLAPMMFAGWIAGAAMP